MKLAKVILFAAACLLSSRMASADIVYVPEFGLIADRSTLQIEIGQVDGLFALSFGIGNAMAGKVTTFVCEDKVVPGGTVIGTAVNKLLLALNDPKRTQLSPIGLIGEIGLHFKEVSNRKPQ